MQPNVSEILALVELKKMKVMSGHEGLQNEVRFVTIMDNPDIVNWLEEHEILLSNGFFFKDFSKTEMMAFIDALIQKKTSALFVKFKRFVTEFDEEILAYAENKAFPIIEVPIEMSWTDLSDPIHRYLNERQFYFLHQAMDLRDDLLSLLVSGGSLNELCQMMAENLQKPLAIFDEKMKLLAHSRQFLRGRFSANQALQGMRHRYTLPFEELIRYEHFYIQLEEFLYILLPIKYGKDLWGYTILETTDETPLLYSDIAKAEQLTALSVVEISKIKELKKIEKKYYSEFIDLLITGKINDYREIQQRGSQLGRKIFQEYVVCLAPKQPAATIVDRIDEVSLQLHGSQVIQESFYTERKEGDLFLIPVVPKTNQNYNHQDVLAQLRQQTTIFVSDVHPIEEISIGYQEARFTLSCEEFMQEQQVAFVDTGILQLFFLNSELNTTFLYGFYEETIFPLAAYDMKKNVELVKTLQTIINNNLNVSLAAQELFIHENTLRSRIRRIEQLTNKSLQNYHDVFQLQLGLYIQKFI